MSPTPPPPPFRQRTILLPGTRVGHYLVEELISAGGFGAVYRVTRDGQNFALKVPLSPGDERPRGEPASRGGPAQRGARNERSELRVTEARIVREVVALMTLNHPGIVGVHGFDRWPDPVSGALYLVMDFVDGTPLLRCWEQDQCSLRELVDVFRLLALAIHEMHSMGVVHRDIKSSNVLLKPGTTSKWQPVLVDFGLARPAHTPNVTSEYVLVGTDGHWAPELLASAGAHFEYTPATDLHALGHLFHQALTGRAPYLADSSGGLMAAVLEQEPPTPSSVVKTLPRVLDAPALRLLAKRPEDRTPSALAFAEELAEILANIPARAPAHEVRAAVDRLRAAAEGRVADPSTRPERVFRAEDPETGLVVTGDDSTFVLSLPARGSNPAPRSKTEAAAAAPEPTRHTALVERPTLPLFVLDPEQLLGRDVAPAKAAAPSGPPAARLRHPASAALRFLSRGVGYALDALFYLSIGAIGLVAVSALESALRHPPSAQWEPGSATGGSSAAAVDGGTASSPSTTPSGPTARTVSGSRRPAPGHSVEASRPTRVKSLVRAALVGHARPGKAQAVLQQPVQLATTALPTGARLDGVADPLPDGRFLLRFDSVRRADGSVLQVNATALVEASAADRRPLKPGPPAPGFEFDLAVAATP